jgi:hypothetical protein
MCSEVLTAREVRLLKRVRAVYTFALFAILCSVAVSIASVNVVLAWERERILTVLFIWFTGQLVLSIVYLIGLNSAMRLLRYPLWVRFVVPLLAIAPFRFICFIIVTIIVDRRIRLALADNRGALK